VSTKEQLLASLDAECMNLVVHRQHGEFDAARAAALQIAKLCAQIESENQCDEAGVEK